jgi:RNA polymerase sigma factor (sigma-70 family)
MSGPRLRSRRSEPLDGERFNRLYQDTSRDLLAFLLRRCLSAEDAADCLAETFRIAWEKRDRIPTGDATRPWLFGIARNVSRRERADEKRAAETVHDLTTAAEQSGARAEHEDGEITDALSQLSPLDQEIITMLAWDGLTPREAAAILGLSPNVVRVRAHRARQRLRELLISNEDSHGAGDSLSALPRPNRIGSKQALKDCRSATKPEATHHFRFAHGSGHLHHSASRVPSSTRRVGAGDWIGDEPGAAVAYWFVSRERYW